jgi:hypothetical protein
VLRLIDEMPTDMTTILLLDDLLARLSFPCDRQKVAARTIYIAGEYITPGYESPRVLLARSSKVTPLLLTTHLIAQFIPADYLSQLHRFSFYGSISPTQRSQLGYSQLVSASEQFYPFLIFPALVFGTRADFLFGGIEVQGYRTNTAFAFSNAASPLGIPAREPDFIPAKFGALRAPDGKYMTGQNGIYLSAPDKTVTEQLSTIQDQSILQDYGSLLDARTQTVPDLLDVWKKKFGKLSSLSKTIAARDIENRLADDERTVSRMVDVFNNSIL